MYNIKEFFKAHMRRYVKKHEVETLYLSKGLRQADIVVATNMHNEVRCVAFFLEYYRALGITEFVILDNDSSDGLQDFLATQKGISLFFSRHKYNKSRYGIDWMNAIFNKHCIGKWILYVDADEFLVYPHQDKWSIKDLVHECKARGQSGLSCTMIDMYSRYRISDNRCALGQDPLEVCSLFDRVGYIAALEKRSNVVWIKGGVRGRIYFADDISRGPALNKIPLIHWRPWYAFIKSTHELTPSVLNKIYSDENSMSGALLHMKFISGFIDLVNDGDIAAAHTEEYHRYADTEKDMSFYSQELSAEFTDWTVLLEAELIRDPPYVNASKRGGSTEGANSKAVDGAAI